uniref:Uncharacterized protein n=1 Tax=Candidatus Kentrum sp. LFY TaxID=2126342 RepID=A0A450V870_9GAMM|nr:MAG: hypothetical protein BECKLFY1418A_GA0070994_11304 [Candidatus Kentron sp. LFY]
MAGDWRRAIRWQRKMPQGSDPSAKRHGRVPIEGWRLIPLGRRVPNVVELEYGGAIQHSVGSGHDSDFSGTAMIGSDSVFLAGHSFWVPIFGDALVTFELTVRGLPASWKVVSQGRRDDCVDCAMPYVT